MNASDLKDVFRALKNLDSVFLAFNSNIDNIKHIDPKMEKFAGNASPAQLNEIKGPADIFSGILYSMKYGESAELTMTSQAENWLSKNIKPEKQRMGGQAGIMANLLAMMDIQPIVYAPLLPKEQCKLFSPKVLLMEKGLRHPSKVRKNDPKKINWIFEFSKGQRFLGIKAKDTTRFIAASRPEKFRLRNINLDFGFSCAILSGFQCILEKYPDGHTYKDQFVIAKNVMQKIKAMGKPVHIEIAFTKNRKIISKTLEIASMADSIGLDDSELIRILQFFGEHKLAERIHVNHDIIDIFLGAKKLEAKLQTKKIHLHGRGFFLAVGKSDYHIRPKEIKKSMEFASVVAAAKASRDIQSKSGIKLGLKYPVSDTGKEAGNKLAGFLAKKGIIMKNGMANDGGFIVFVPIRMVQSVRDVVGLGDIISASIFAAETGYSLES